MIMNAIKIVLSAFITVFMVSCNTYYRTVTTLGRNGEAVREVYAKGDSAFMAGNMSENPYLFDINSGWEITRFDSGMKYDFFGDEKDVNVKVSKSVSSIDLLSKELSCSEDKKSFVAPEESLNRKFKWFYTNYKFTGVYKKLSYNVPVSIDKYLSKEEQKIWGLGDFGDYAAMNGSEMNEMLDGIEGKFMDWYSRNCFEISLNSIIKLSKEAIGDAEKDEIYKQMDGKNQGADLMPETVCKALDSYYKTDRFSEMNRNNQELLGREFKEVTSLINLFGNIISYELVVPGEIINTNAPIVNSNSLIWKIDAMRILFDDYTLTAEYRVVNLWAFILSGLILITAIVSTLLLIKKKSNM